MAAMVLTPTSTNRSGVVLPQVTPTDLELRFTNTQNEVLVINGTAAVTVTLWIAATIDGQTVTNKTVNVALNETRMIGPFKDNIYNQSDGTVKVTLSALTCKVGLIVKGEA